MIVDQQLSKKYDNDDFVEDAMASSIVKFDLDAVLQGSEEDKGTSSLQYLHELQHTNNEKFTTGSLPLEEEEAHSNVCPLMVSVVCTILCSYL